MAVGDTYNTSVGKYAGAKEFFGKDDGKFHLGENFLFYAENGSVKAGNLIKSLASANSIVRRGQSGAGISGGSLIVPGYGYHFFAADTGASQGILTLPSAIPGAFLVLDFDKFSDNANAAISKGALSAVDKAGLEVSSINASAGAILRLGCVNEGEWAVLESNDSVTIGLA